MEFSPSAPELSLGVKSLQITTKGVAPSPSAKSLPTPTTRKAKKGTRTRTHELLKRMSKTMNKHANATATHPKLMKTIVVRSHSPSSLPISPNDLHFRTKILSTTRSAKWKDQRAHPPAIESYPLPLKLSRKKRLNLRNLGEIHRKTTRRRVSSRKHIYVSNVVHVCPEHLAETTFEDCLSGR